MTNRPEIDPSMMRYLLGELEPEEEAALDERAFVDDDWEEERDTAADELIEAYLADALRAEERARFEAHFLASAAHRERFRMLRDLRAALAHPAATDPVSRPSVRPGWAWIAVAAALLAALAALVFSGRSPAADPRVALATPAPIATPRPTATAIARTVTVAVRDASRSVAVAVGPDVRTVRFEIPVPEAGAPSYSVTVRRGAETVWQREDLVPEEAGAPVAVGVPADVLADGAVLSIEGEAMRSATPAPPVVRRWTLHLTGR